MMDIQKLRDLAQAVISASDTKRTLTVSSHAIALSEFEHAATPEIIISLIERLEKAESQLAERDAQIAALEENLNSCLITVAKYSGPDAAPPAPAEQDFIEWLQGNKAVSYQKCTEFQSLAQKIALATLTAEPVKALDKMPRQYQNGFPLDYTDYACGWNDYHDEMLRLNAVPPAQVKLIGGSLKTDGHIWYKAETIVELLNAAGVEVEQ